MLKCSKIQDRGNMSCACIPDIKWMVTYNHDYFKIKEFFNIWILWNKW